MIPSKLFSSRGFNLSLPLTGNKVVAAPSLLDLALFPFSPISSVLFSLKISSVPFSLKGRAVLSPQGPSKKFIPFYQQQEKGRLNKKPPTSSPSTLQTIPVRDLPSSSGNKCPTKNSISPSVGPNKQTNKTLISRLKELTQFAMSLIFDLFAGIKSVFS